MKTTWLKNTGPDSAKQIHDCSPYATSSMSWGRGQGSIMHHKYAFKLSHGGTCNEERDRYIYKKNFQKNNAKYRQSEAVQYGQSY